MHCSVINSHSILVRLEAPRVGGWTDESHRHFEAPHDTLERQPTVHKPTEREKEKKNSIWKQHKLCWILHFMQLWAAQLWINCLESPPVAPAVAGFFFRCNQIALLCLLTQFFICCFFTSLLRFQIHLMQNQNKLPRKQAAAEASLLGQVKRLLCSMSNCSIVSFFPPLRHIRALKAEESRLAVVRCKRFISAVYELKCYLCSLSSHN